MTVGTRYAIIPPVGQLTREQARSCVKPGEAVVGSILLDAGSILKIDTRGLVDIDGADRLEAIKFLRAAGLSPKQFRMFDE